MPPARSASGQVGPKHQGSFGIMKFFFPNGPWFHVLVSHLLAEAGQLVDTNVEGYSVVSGDPRRESSEAWSTEPRLGIAGGPPTGKTGRSPNCWSASSAGVTRSAPGYPPGTR